MSTNNRKLADVSEMDDGTKVYDLFVSYHWRDRAAAEGLAQALNEHGLKVFLDRWYLVPGQRWQSALEKVLLSCRAVTVLLGPHGLGNWQQREKELALDRQAREADFPVIPALLPGAEPGLEFLTLNTWVDLREGVKAPEVLSILARAARGEAPGPAVAERAMALRATVCPFRGLSCFREEDAPFFFGRESFSDRLVKETSRRSFLGVVGASGSGKSSVVRAGLLPHLRRSPGGCVWEIATVVPGDRPLRALAASLLPLLEPKTMESDENELERLERINRLTAYLAEKEDGLRDVVERIMEKQPGTNRLLLFVDQWEELYTIASDEAAQLFIGGLLRTTEGAPLSVVLTLRGDFFGRALAQRSLADRLQDAVVNLGPMTPEELRRALVKPAVQVGLKYQQGLENRILEDVGDEPGNLPLLEFVLKRLWEERRGGELHHEAYDAMEGVEGAIAKRAEAVWTSLIDQGGENEKRLRRVFLELVHSEEGTKDTRRRIELEKLGEGAGDLVAELTRERLLVTGRDEATGKETLEVAHEALISHWERLQRWLDEDHDFRMWRQRLSVGLMEWVQSGRRDSGTLLRGGPLAEAERWLGARGEDLSIDERTFIKASTKNRIRRKWVQGSVAAVIFLILALISAWQYRELEIERAKRRPIEPEMVIIKPGQFTMGSSEEHESPPHEVVIKKPFAIGRFEVTFAEFDKFAYDTGRRPAYDEGWGGGNRPVINVTWEDARKYAEWLSEKTGKLYRLPTEAEWEYAARAGTETAFSFGPDDSKLGEFAWYWENSEKKTHPVGEKKPNAWGLYDMYGNVWEWVEDDWHGSYGGAPDDGNAWVDNPRSNTGVIRGCGWSSDSRNCRSTVRIRSRPDRSLDYVGFRLSRSIDISP